MGKILIIDDDEVVRDGFELALHDSGHDVVLASDGDIGIKKFLAENPDLIFLDLNMPDLNGVDVLRELRKHEVSVPIFIVTAFAQNFAKGLKESAQEDINFEMALKPLNSNQIRSIVDAVLGATPEQLAEDR